MATLLAYACKEPRVKSVMNHRIFFNGYSIVSFMALGGKGKA